MVWAYSENNIDSCPLIFNTGGGNQYAFLFYLISIMLWLDREYCFHVTDEETEIQSNSLSFLVTLSQEVGRPVPFAFCQAWTQCAVCFAGSPLCRRSFVSFFSLLFAPQTCNALSESLWTTMVLESWGHSSWGRVIAVFPLSTDLSLWESVNYFGVLSCISFLILHSLDQHLGHIMYAGSARGIN